MRYNSKTVFKFLAIPAGIYALYVIGMIVLLNTSLFSRLVGMQDEELTHIRFHGAYSFFPGHLRSGEMKIAIRDENVRVTLDLKGVDFRFAIRSLFRETLEIGFLEVRELGMTVQIKSDEEKAKHIDAHSKPEDLVPISQAKHDEHQEARWRFLIPRLKIEKASPLRFGDLEIKGDILVVGGFRLQPGVDAEVFPSSIEFRHADAGSDLKDLEGRIDARFLPFPIDRIEGNQVFEYATGEVALRGRAENLRILNVTLKSLPGYRFGRSQTNIETKIALRSGQFTEGSYFRTSMSEISFQAPRFELEGAGQLEWLVKKGAKACGKIIECGESRLSVRFPHASSVLSIGDSGKVRGKATGIEAFARIHGTHLSNVFLGMRAALSLKGASLSGKGTGWKLDSNWRGKLAALGGIVPKAWVTDCKEKSQFTVETKSFSYRPPDENPIEGRGNILITLCPLDFRSGQLSFPDVRVEASAHTPLGGAFDVSARLTDLIQRANPAEGADATWKGKLRFRLGGAKAWLDWLKERKGLSSVVSTLLRTDVVEGSAEWELIGDRQWARFDDVHSSGLWTAWGTYSADADRKLIAAEAHVAGVPVGVTLIDRKFNYTLFPEESWYPFEARSFPKLPKIN